MKQSINSGRESGIGHCFGIILSTLLLCLFACTNTDAQITKTLLEQQFSRFYLEDDFATYTTKEFFIADLTADGIDEGLVTYLAESNNMGNYWGLGTVIFHMEQGELRHFEVIIPNNISGEAFRSYTVTGVSDGIIHVTTLDYAPDDPYCCPSIQTKHKFRLVGRTLVELQ